MDGRQDPGRVAEVIRELEADIVGLQGADSSHRDTPWASPRGARVQVGKLLDVLMAEPDRITIVMGDINEWLPGSRPLRWLQGRLGRSPAPRTFPAFFPLFALDRIWVWPNRALLSIRAHDSPVARIASDHLPLAADVAAFPLVAERMPSLDMPRFSPSHRRACWALRIFSIRERL